MRSSPAIRATSSPSPTRTSISLQVERAAATTAALARLGDHAAALEAATAALRSWRGDTLADCRELDFARADAARGDELRQVLTEQVLAARLELGEAAAVVPEAEALTKRHPEREATWRTLMLALYRSGRQEEALAAFAAARRRLDEGAGLEPSPALRALHTAILNHDPLLAPARGSPRRPPRARATAAPVTPLVGAPTRGLGRVLDDLRSSAPDVADHRPQWRRRHTPRAAGPARVDRRAPRRCRPSRRWRAWSGASLVAGAWRHARRQRRRGARRGGNCCERERRADGLPVVDRAPHVLGSTPLLAELVATAP